MKAIQLISQDLFDKVRSRFTNLEMGDETGAVTIDPAEARFFDFDFVNEGVNLGRVSISLNDLGSLKIYYSQGITENQDDPSKQVWYGFLKEMRMFAMRRLLRFDTRDIAKTNLDRNDFQHLAATQAPKEDPEMNNMNEIKKIKKSVAENTGRELTNTPRDRLISRMSPSVDNNALLQKVGKVVNSPEFDSDAILKIVDAGDTMTHPVGRYIQKEFDELQYDLGREYEDHPEEVAEKLLSMLKDRTQQGLQESRWSEKSSRKTSRAIQGKTEVIVRHSSPVDETYAGSRSQRKNIKAIFIQNQDGERFKYPFIHPAGAFAMAQHVDHGGTPHDPAGKAIIDMSEQIAKLGEFQRKIHTATLHPDATGITERAVGRLQELKNQVACLSKRQHYQNWMAEFQEPQDPVLSELDAVTMEDYKSKFTQTSFQEELAAYFPILHRVMSETNTVDLESYVNETDVEEDEEDTEVKESAFDAFEEWANATESGEITDDQVTELANAIAALPQSTTGPELALGDSGSEAADFFASYGLDDRDLQQKLKDAANGDSDTDPFSVLKSWAEDEHNYPGLMQRIGIKGDEAPAEQPPEAPAEQPPEAGADQQPPAEGDDEENEKPQQSQGSMFEEIAKLVSGRFNRDNMELGAFNGEPNIALEVKKEIAEQFGEDAGVMAEQLALKFMEKLSMERDHGQDNQVQDDGLSMDRLRELMGNVKAKFEAVHGMEEEKDNWHPSKHVTDPQKQKELEPHNKNVHRDSYADRAAYLDAAGVPDDRGPQGEGVDPVNVPAYIRQSKEPGKQAARAATDKRNNAAGAKVWSSPRLPKESFELESILKLAGLDEGSSSKEKQKTPYRDINGPGYKAAADKQREKMAKDKAAEPGKKLADKISNKK